MQDQNKFNYIIQQADNCLILGQRLAELCGHGPVLEQDIATTNISLDLIGQARLFYQYAAELQEEGKTEDDLAYLRDAWDFKNVLLVRPDESLDLLLCRTFCRASFCFPRETWRGGSSTRGRLGSGSCISAGSSS